MYQILTRSKDLNDPVLGNMFLNRLGLHAWRVALADRCTAWRRRSADIDPGWQQAIQRDGFLVIKEFLPTDAFQALKGEAEEAISQSRADGQGSPHGGRGFGKKQARPWGFDRYDGGTLNRFVSIDPGSHREAAAFRSLKSLRELSVAVAGRAQKPQHVWYYLTRHGTEGDHEDPQKRFHRDTFFSSQKFWYFLHPVTRDDGPFEYVPGSHKVTRRRLAWEQAQAMQALKRPRGKRGASFRIDAAEIDAMGFGPARQLTVPANTLVIADTFGFHRRGSAKAGAERLAMYGNMRPWPFAPLRF